MACGDGAVLSHRSAAALWGIRPTAAARVDITVSHTSGVRSSARIVVHRSRRPIEQVLRDGIPVTTAGRTLADLATALPRRDLEKACEAAEALALSVEIDPDHLGSRRLREVTGIVEIDGRRHRTRAAFERGRARDALLTAVGWRVVHFTTRQVRGDPVTVAARVLSARSPLLATP